MRPNVATSLIVWRSRRGAPPSPSPGPVRPGVPGRRGLPVRGGEGATHAPRTARTGATGPQRRPASIRQPRKPSSASSPSSGRPDLCGAVPQPDGLPGRSRCGGARGEPGPFRLTQHWGSIGAASRRRIPNVGEKRSSDPRPRALVAGATVGCGTLATGMLAADHPGIRPDPSCQPCDRMATARATEKPRVQKGGRLRGLAASGRAAWPGRVPEGDRGAESQRKHPQYWGRASACPPLYCSAWYDAGAVNVCATVNVLEHGRAGGAPTPPSSASDAAAAARAQRRRGGPGP